MLSNKENFLRLVRQEETDGIPVYNLWWALNSPSIYMKGRNPDGTGLDYFGVEWYLGEGIVPAALPKPGNFILPDITRWRDVIRVPDFITDVDWDVMASEQLANRNPDNPFGGTTAPSVGFFQALMSFMGFDEGLMALYEEPEEVRALMEYLTDWACEMARKFIDHYRPDFGFLADDIAHERNPFVSLEQFQEFFAPAWRRYYSVFLEAGLPVGNHNCGYFQPLLGELVDMGGSFWDPVQSSNDVAAIKAQFGKKIALCMGPEQRFWDENTTEEQVRSEIIAFLDTAAPGGGFAISEGLANFTPREGMPEAMVKRMTWITEEVQARRFGYYS
jgi:uroporphyrinogen-III decarboxylase